jgi:Flp pilus assembly protein TadG
MTTTPGSKHRERGASLVEFAFVAPFLLLLLLGTVELGWALGLNNDVRHGAREAARLAAVSAPSLSTAVCDSMDLSSGQTVVYAMVSGSGDTGSTGAVTVTAPAGSLSGVPLISWVVPATLSSTVEFRLEQDASGWGGGTTFNC